MGLAGGYVARQLVRQATFVEMLHTSAWHIGKHRMTSPDHDHLILYCMIL